LGLLALWCKKYRKIILFAAFVLWLLSLKMVGNILLEPLENKKYPLPKTPPQAVVVLGGGKTEKASNLPLLASATKRLLYGMMLSYQKRLPLIISGCEGAWAKKSLLEISNYIVQRDH